ncbi:putative protein N(5)-glutamine methyltransferase [Sinomonas sp. ASV486]|uniref:putative protein N(5)-glutamine methyltransferase n=1 Tax=Sinomonas sp. ASV486 TaxID=3051170 RepID=UPI0027DCD34D|nr:putative protein N(5)-glutamine methyltransferase [Sinomonas sp. ASV486]MDQ4492237.1 putative protein N(5)-glutamine methyltransferase [Sinomonas sp. ASV486]
MTSAWPEPAEPLLAGIAARLRAAGCVFAEEEAALLVEAVSGRTAAGGAAADAAELERLVALRVAGEPLEHLLGWAEFAGLRIAVGPGVFVPRRRSELLVRLAVEHLAGLAHDAGGAPAVVVDLCCGSGALGAGIASALEARGWGADEFEVHAADFAEAATACARRNLAAWGGRVRTGDLYSALPEGLRGRVNVLVANAPYVPTGALPLMPPEAREHEPALALDGGADGLDVHRRIAAGAHEWLAPGGALLIELGERQVTDALALLTGVGLRPRAEEDDELGALAIVATAPRE